MEAIRKSCREFHASGEAEWIGVKRRVGWIKKLSHEALYVRAAIQLLHLDIRIEWYILTDVYLWLWG